MTSGNARRNGRFEHVIMLQTSGGRVVQLIRNDRGSEVRGDLLAADLILNSRAIAAACTRLASSIGRSLICTIVVPPRCAAESP